MSVIRKTLLAVGAIVYGSIATQLPAQAPPAAGWNDSRVLDLVRRGIERRSSQVVDTTLQTYSAQGRGYVYFLLDAPELDRQTLVRTDQVALDIHWKAPDQMRQRIVGMRKREELPVRRLHYYLDRLTVVQDNFGQAIVIADGDNVKDVSHPIAPGAEYVYDYRLADSLALMLPGLDEPVRVHEIEVKPKRPEEEAVIGSVFLEAETGALVRMSFTFTPSSYVDPRLDFINVTLENGLWQGRFWLPREQRLEIRREIPELDLPFGTVIRTRMRVSGYTFNESVPEWLFAVPMPVTLAAREQREAFEFEQPIDAEWRLEGIGTPMDVTEIRRTARAMLQERTISGLPRTRPALGSLSDLVRYNRAEGLMLGFGWGVRPLPTLSSRAHAGWLFGPERPTGRVEVAYGERVRLGAQAYLNRRGEVGGEPAASGITNTIGSLFFARDWTEPFHASGGEASVQAALGGGWSIRGTLRGERQRSAELTETYSVFEPSTGFRPVRAIDDGNLGSLEVGLRRDGRTATGGWWGELTVSGARLDASAEDANFDFGRAELEGGAAWSHSSRRARVDLQARLGYTLGEIPRQELYLIGGRNSLPGFDYHSAGGDRLALLRTTASADLAHPWIRGRLTAGIGWTDLGDAGAAAAVRWGGLDSGTFRGTIGAGFGVFYDLLHIDVARGIGPGARTELIVEVQPEFWDVL